jgi:hypothetical protein
MNVPRELAAVARELQAASWDHDEVSKTLDSMSRGLKTMARDAKKGNLDPQDIEDMAESLTEIAGGYKDWLG